MPCVISLGRLASDLAALPALTPGALVEAIGTEAREALGGERLDPRAIAEGCGILSMGLAGLGLASEEAAALVARLREMLVE